MNFSLSMYVQCRFKGNWNNRKDLLIVSIFRLFFCRKWLLGTGLESGTEFWLFFLCSIRKNDLLDMTHSFDFFDIFFDRQCLRCTSGNAYPSVSGWLCIRSRIGWQIPLYFRNSLHLLRTVSSRDDRVQFLWLRSSARSCRTGRDTRFEPPLLILVKLGIVSRGIIISTASCFCCLKCIWGLGRESSLFYWKSHDLYRTSRHTWTTILHSDEVNSNQERLSTLQVKRISSRSCHFSSSTRVFSTTIFTSWLQL